MSNLVKQEHSWQVIYDGNDITNNVESIFIQTEIDNISNATIRFFEIVIDAYKDINIYIDGEMVFEGATEDPDYEVDGPQATVTEGMLQCQDESINFRGAVVYGNYSGQIDNIIEEMISQDPYTDQFTRYIADIDESVELKYNYNEMLSALRGLCDTVGAHLFIKPGKELYIFKNYWKDGGTIYYKDVNTPYDVNIYTEDFYNEVIVVGGEGMSRDEYYYEGDSETTDFYIPQETKLPRLFVTEPGSEEEQISLYPKGEFTLPEDHEALWDSSNNKIEFIDPPETGTNIRVEVRQSYKVQERIMDHDSIAELGRAITHVVTDNEIKDNATARLRGQVELERAGNMSRTLDFYLLGYKNITAGQRVFLNWLGLYGFVESSGIEIQSKNFIQTRLEVTLDE